MTVQQAASNVVKRTNVRWMIVALLFTLTAVNYADRATISIAGPAIQKELGLTSIHMNHNYGCGVAINAPQAVVPIRSIQNLAKHPNFGGELMIVSLGCEKLRPEVVAAGNNDAIYVQLQDEDGMKKL